MSLLMTKMRMSPAATAPPLVGENGFVQLNNWLCFLSLQTSFVSDQLQLQTKVTRYFHNKINFNLLT